MKNCYPVSLLTAAPRGNGDLTAPGGSKMRDPGDEVDGTQSRNQSNEPPLGNSLLFKSDLMPLLYPTLPRNPKGWGGGGVQLTGVLQANIL